jgi:hypothetical protein
MSEHAQSMDEATLKFGLLMESAQAHQKIAETHLEGLRAHTQDLDGVVREEIRRTLMSELESLSVEATRATETFRRLRRGIVLRGGVGSALTAILCTSLPMVVMHWTLPTESDISALRIRRDELAATVTVLEKRGGRIDWRRCGEAARLCVRVERKVPPYGEKADYYIVAGY